MTAGAGTLYGFLHGPQPLLLPREPSLWVVVLWIAFGFRSMVQSLTRRTTWKDRVISSSQRPRNR